MGSKMRMNLHGLNKGFGLKLHYQLQQAPKEGWKVQWLKGCDSNN